MSVVTKESNPELYNALFPEDEIKEILDEMKQICDVWVKVDGNIKSYNQDQIHEIYNYITNLEQKYQDAINQSIEDHKYASKKKR